MFKRLVPIFFYFKSKETPLFTDKFNRSGEVV